MQFSTLAFSAVALSASSVVVVASPLPGQEVPSEKEFDGAYCPASQSCHVVYDPIGVNYITWHDARFTSRTLTPPDECLGEGKLQCKEGETLKRYLVSINNQGEQDCLKALMGNFPTPLCNDENNPDTCPRPWTGAHQIALAGTSIEPAGGFEWDSGEDFYNNVCDTSCTKAQWINDMVYGSWRGTNPDDGGNSEVEHFVELSPLTDGSNGNERWRWNDRNIEDQNRYVNGHFIVEFKCVETGTNGDPHFTTWSGQKFDYHGQCDLELMSDPDFGNGKGLRIHTRTEIVRTWSYIRAAAIQIGDDVLEVEGSLDPQEQRHWINDVFNGELTTIGGYRVAYKTNGNRRRYIIYLPDHAKIVLGAYKDWVRVDFYNYNHELFGNTVGLLGDYEHGQRLARDGVTIIKDFDAFGQEWQVQADAPMLFHEIVGPQAPFDKCIVPENAHAEDVMDVAQLRGRRLAESKVSQEQAVTACSQPGIRAQDLDSCVADVLGMDDVDYAEAHITMDEDWDADYYEEEDSLSAHAS